LICINVLPFVRLKKSAPSVRVLGCVLMLVTAVSLAACGNKDKKAGQVLAKVDGEEITTLQLNDELRRAGVQAGQEEAARKQLLESLIDRQLVLAEAARNKVDRSPEVVQAIERAKAQIVAQAYLQNVTSKVAKPSRAEIDDYFQKHPELFSKRKEFAMKTLLIPSKSFNDELKLLIGSAKLLDQVSEWMDQHGMQYVRGQAIRSSTDLPPEAASKLLELPKGQLFITSEGDNKVLNMIVAVTDSPITAAIAAPQIERFLANKTMKDVAGVEVASLRSRAKIEYLNVSAANNKQAEPK
jgi:peptidyl-prolyl cis-trans isomerase C